MVELNQISLVPIQPLNHKTILDPTFIAEVVKESPFFYFGALIIKCLNDVPNISLSAKVDLLHSLSFRIQLKIEKMEEQKLKFLSEIYFFRFMTSFGLILCSFDLFNVFGDF